MRSGGGEALLTASCADTELLPGTHPHPPTPDRLRQPLVWYSCVETTTWTAQGLGRTCPQMCKTAASNTQLLLGTWGSTPLPAAPHPPRT